MHHNKMFGFREAIATPNFNIIQDRQHGSTLAPTGIDISSTSSDKFDANDEPTLYMTDNRTSASLEYSSLLIYVIFVALILALVSISPGIRKTKLTSILSLVTIVVMGAAIMLGLGGSHWLTGGVQLHGLPYSAISKDTFSGRLEANIGLSSANVSLLGRLMSRGSNGIEYFVGNSIHYNERFSWNQPEEMALEHLDSLRKGLPYPILTVTEFFSQGLDGFNWTHQLRMAGYYTTMALYMAAGSWLVTCVVMCALPCYLAHMMQVTGSLIMLSVSLYTILIESPSLYSVQIGIQRIHFAYGHTYMTSLLAGSMSLFVGVLIYVIQTNRPHDQVTVMDCENFIKNQKQVSSFMQVLASQRHNNTASASINPAAESVFIPIEDIEKNFPRRSPAPKDSCAARA